MFKAITNKYTLDTCMSRMYNIQNRLNQGKQLTDKDEKLLKLFIFGIKGGEFRDEAHRDKLISQWWAGAKLLDKRFKKEKEKAKK